MSCEVAQKIDVACNKTVLCDDRHRIAKSGQHFETAASNAQLSLDRLIRIGHAAQHQRLRLPPRRFQFTAQQLWRACFHHDLAFEIESGGKAEIFVRWSGVTIDAAMFAPSIRIQACLKPNIRTVVTTDDRFGFVAKILRCTPWPFFRFKITTDNVGVI